MLVDPHRDLARAALGLVPPGRRADVLYLDVAERSRPFGLNLLDTGLFPDRDKAVTKAWQVSTLPTTFVLGRGLAPRLVAEGDFEWDRPDARHALEALTDAEPAAESEAGITLESHMEESR